MGHASRGAEREVSETEVCVLVVLFGWKQRPFWQDRGLSAQLGGPFWNRAWAEVFPAQGQTLRQLRAPSPRGNPFVTKW